eukprot:Nitzschia sp. Nitz4//scaffold106_size73319//57749//58656//NITZ4_005744-RA/size73319-processed-gene-0.59-mRNA-1//1//CDS//3329532544//7131//frame0
MFEEELPAEVKQRLVPLSSFLTPTNNNTSYRYDTVALHLLEYCTRTMKFLSALFLITLSSTTHAFVVLPVSSSSLAKSLTHTALAATEQPQPVSPVSPFESNPEAAKDVNGKAALALTWENVDSVLDEMRPFLKQDGGNVALREIDGPVVHVEMQGACGGCASSTQTIQLGLEKRLKERIPEIVKVVEFKPQGPPLNEEQAEIVLGGVRPFLEVVGGSIGVANIAGQGGIQPCITLKVEGGGTSLNSVKTEIAQRLRDHFKLPTLRIQYKS